MDAPKLMMRTAMPLELVNVTASTAVPSASLPKLSRLSFRACNFGPFSIELIYMIK
jgi:hypothetical protein